MQDSIFSDLTSHELDEILKFTDEVKFSSGTVILQQDAPGNALFIVKSGTAQLIKKTEAGEPLNMGLVEQGMFLGELAVLDNGRQPATATAEAEVTALQITKEKLDLLYKINKRIYCKLFLSLVRYVNFRLRIANEKYATSRSNLRKF
ncbi:MAG: cyclic nucleotide-binding domain-containing protein [Candidatus Wallbacteria bacterium]|nr:cyclic nucleotide-binding domain-containing protein [Candidatus Wallbacteria bacterium]